ncbi:E3 SUMO-protein ligase RanBP2-like isoform X2 [Littorina saxatilis]|uniref:E3 SUMO-protein ligase RanBP2-like isoform X2 n=1 Tax=Littorina saxatilis TaxID=31220 RepID=UPI0038B499C8
MFRRKQDVDRHVKGILGKIKEDKEKNAKGYQIARLYFEVGEFDIARRHLALFLSVRDSVPQAYKLLGQIEEAKGNKENAVEAYKRFLEMGGTAKDVLLKICELYADIGVDPDKGKYWLDRAEQLHPKNETLFKLKEKLITSRPAESTDKDLENLIASELVKKPHDVELRIKLLRVYLSSDRVEEAYANAMETDRTTAFTTSLEWYECLHDVFRAYRSERDTRQDAVFMFHCLVVLCNLTYLRLSNKDVVESTEALHSFDLAVHSAMNMNNASEQWDAFVMEMQGQLFFFAGTLLLKRAQKGSVTWNDIRPVAAVFYLLCQTTPTVDAQATWFVRPTQDHDKLYAWLYKNSFFRISQTGHSLYQLCPGDPTTWARQLQQQCCTPIGQERVYEALFPNRDMRSHSSESYLMNTHKFCNTNLSMPPRRQLLDVDRVAHTFHPDNLWELVWLCLQQYTFGDPHQPDYNFKTFETLQYSVKNMDNGAAETLCQLDTEAFQYATVRCAALQLKEQQMSIEGDVLRPPMLPLCLCKRLCTMEQQQWWQTAYTFYSNSIKDNFAKMRHILQRGIEAVRLIGSHGLSATMIVHLAKTFDAKRRPCRARMSREELVKSLTEGNHGNRGSANQVACLEARAALYWNHAHTVLTRFEKNMRGQYGKVRLFDDGNDADLTPEVVRDMTQDTKFAVAVIAMREGRYEEAVRGFEPLTTPYASFYRAQIYKSMAQRELEGPGAEDVKQQRYTALIAQAREALYRTMDHLGGNKNHELNILLTREIDDVESKLNCFDWVNRADNDNSNRGDLDETSVLHTPTRHQNGRHDNLIQPHSTPRTPSQPNSARQRLLLSEMANDSPIQLQHTAMGSPSAHARPSPERLDAQIKSINYSQSQLFKMVLDRNEELLVMYKGLVDELRDSNAQLKVAMGENHVLMEELRGVLTTNKNAMAAVQSELAETKDSVRQLKDEFQANTAAAAAAAASNTSLLNAQGLAASQINAAGYYMGSPYHPAAQYPQYPQAPHVAAPPGAGYRFPLLSGYPAPRPATPVATPAAIPVAAALPPPRLSEQPGGTVPSSFGKFRGDHPTVADVLTTEDEEEEDENGLSMCDTEYSEALLHTPGGGQYYVPSDPMADWLHGAGAVAYPAANQSPAQAAIPQPGYFSAALRGQALQYAATSGSAAQPLTMPGPGFFSAPVVPSVAGAGVGVGASQSAIATALGGKAGVVPPQPISVIGAGVSKPAQQPVVQAAELSEAQGTAMLFHNTAKLTTSVGEIPAVDVRVIQDTATKQGSIILHKKDNQAVVSKHNVAVIKVVQSFNPHYFLWSVASTQRKLEETFRLSFDTSEQAKRMRNAVELVIKTAGIRPPTSPAPTPNAFAGKSPAQASPNLAAVVSTPAVVRSPQTSAALSGAKPSPAVPSPSSTAGNKTTFGGFTFTSAPVVKQGEEEKDGAAKSSPQLKLKESQIHVPAPAAAPAGVETTKPFAGFSFAPSKMAASAFGSAVSSSASTGGAGSGVTASPGQAFVFGQASPATGGGSFASVSNQAGSEAFKPKEGTAGIQASTQPLFSQSTAPFKSPGGKEDENVEEYEPNVDFKPIIELPDLVEVKTGEEDEVKVLSDRVKLFRFDTELNQWKERGIGELKILKSSEGAVPRFRVIMRREQVLKVCANHYISADMKLIPMSSSDRAWCYTAGDFAEEEMKVEKFAVKFKNSDKAGEFKAIFENCQKELADAQTSSSAVAAPVPVPVPTKQKEGTSAKSLSDMFRQPEGAWECSGCYINNKADVLNCPACQTLKPGAKAQDAKSPPKENPFAPAASTGGFGGLKFGAAAEKKSLSDMFRQPEGAWECSGCYINNKADVLNCPACQTLKPGAKAQDAKSPPKENPFAPAASTGGFGGLKFGAAAEKKESPAATGGGFKFGTAPGSTPEAGGFKFGTPQKTAPVTTAESTPTTSGFKFTFGTPTTKAPAATTSTPSSGFVFGTPTAKPAASPAQPSGFAFSSSGASKDSKDTGFSFAKPQEQKPECGSALLQQLLTSEDSPETKPKLSAFGNTPPPGMFSGASDASKPSGFQSKLGQVTSPTNQTGAEGKEAAGFQFTFNLQKQQQQQPSTPKTPEVDEKGFYLNKDGDDAHIYFEPVVPLPEKVEVKTGEEEEEILFEGRAKMYRFTDKEWKERGLGVIKILQHRDTGRIRVLMRREQVLKICCNHYITGELDLKPMPRSDGKAWIWYAMDFTEDEGSMEQLAVRFRDPDTANRFKKVFDESREKMMTPSKAESGNIDPSKSDAASATSPADVSRRLFQQEDDGDVEFMYEETATPEQVERARQLMLPDNFYLYESKPGCPGCIGCEDFDPAKSPSVPAAKVHQKAAPPTAPPTTTERPQLHQPVQEEAAQKASEGMMFSGSSSDLTFSALAATSDGSPGFGSKDSNKPFQWHGAGQRLFGAGGGDGGEEGEEGVPASGDIHFEPVIPLPDLVEVKTGDEDWSPLFSQRGKVFAFDNNQWKERGIGEMKIMKHNSQMLFRVLMRREQVLKVACNQLITTDMELKPMATSETAWCWLATDYTDGKDGKTGQFAVRFKKMETAKQFKELFEECQKKLRQCEAEGPVQETMVSSSQQLASAQASDGETAAAQDEMHASVQPVAAQDEMHASVQPVAAQDEMHASVQPVAGDKGNPYYSQQLNVSAKDNAVSSSQPVTGDKGNPYYTQQLNASGNNAEVASSQPVTGDKGNPYFSRALDVDAQDANVTSTSFQPLGGGGGDINVDGAPNFSKLLGPDSSNGAEDPDEEYDDDEDDEDEDDDEETTEEDDDDEEEKVEFEKRVTLLCRDGDQWKKLGMGNLRVLYDDDLNANKLLMMSDDGEKICNHIICMEQTVGLDEKKKSCEWQPIDFATDEPVRRHFKAYFSSLQAAEEFATIFRQGQKLAVESEISSKVPEEIEVPEVFSTGDRSEGASAGATK